MPDPEALQLDLQKFFNMVPTEATLALCQAAGVDSTLIKFLERHYSQLRQHNRLPAGHLGRAWKGRCGLPQGDPLSVSLANIYLSSALHQADNILSKQAKESSTSSLSSTLLSTYLDDITMVAATKSQFEEAGRGRHRHFAGYGSCP